MQKIPGYVDKVIVADNNSGDQTRQVALSLAEQKKLPYYLQVTCEKTRGYGATCLRAMKELQNEDIVVFLDGDLSDDPGQMHRLLDPIINKETEITLANRFNSENKNTTMSFAQKFGTRLAVHLMRWFFGYHFQDLGPFRALTYGALKKINLQDKNFGFTIELQIKAGWLKIPFREIDMPYYDRNDGKSKVSGTLWGVLGAAYKILGLVFYYRVVLFFKKRP